MLPLDLHSAGRYSAPIYINIYQELTIYNPRFLMVETLSGNHTGNTWQAN